MEHADDPAPGDDGGLGALPLAAEPVGYAWQVSLDPDEMFVCAHTAAYRAQLVGCGGLVPVPEDRLRIVVQEFGPATRPQLDQIIDVLALRAMYAASIDLVFYRPEIIDGQVRWEPAPPGPLAQLRDLAREAVAGILGAVPGRADGFVPHMVIATSDGQVSVEQIAERLAAAATRQVAVRFRVERLDLVAQFEDGAVRHLAQAVLCG